MLFLTTKTGTLSATVYATIPQLIHRHFVPQLHLLFFMSHYSRSTLGPAMIQNFERFRKAGWFSEEQMIDFLNAPRPVANIFEIAKPKPLAVADFYNPRKSRMMRLDADGSLTQLQEGLRSKLTGEGLSQNALSPSDTPTTPESTPGVIDGLAAGSSDVSASDEEVRDTVILALNLLNIDVFSSSYPVTPATTPPSTIATRPHSTFATPPSPAISAPPSPTPAALPSPTPAALPPPTPISLHPLTPAKVTQFVRRSCRVRIRPATYAETLPSTSKPSAPAKARTRPKAKATAKGKARPSKVSTATPGPSKAKAKGKKPCALREATSGSDEENVPAVSPPTGRRPPKRPSSNDDDDDEYVEHHPAKRQKMEPAADHIAANNKTPRQPRIKADILDNLVIGEVRGPCPWAGCEYELRGTKHGPLRDHFVTHVKASGGRAVLKSTAKDLFRCPACLKNMRGDTFVVHVLEVHLGAQWKCLLWNHQSAPCDWKGKRADRVAQHCGGKEPEHQDPDPLHLQALADARMK
ncbi:hypothetical protein GSI_10438 [Ganoderma sinense ZZ0214-1]|uniref:Uncharacterized protein n=1 Tax=Ganoderma sinense ZZ0214-1 TaxID=1077348 RepID=A0A2G8S0K5_9APHY|nr:hypothetical protein GSI_10438 [Ganoderma sinense ZZ0214-1]